MMKIFGATNFLGLNDPFAVITKLLKDIEFMSFRF